MSTQHDTGQVYYVKQGIHFSEQKEVFTVVQNGIPEDRPWNHETVINTHLLDTLFDYIGIGPDDKERPGSPELKARAREATRQYFTFMFVEWGPQMRHGMDNEARAFYNGFLAGVRTTASE